MSDVLVRVADTGVGEAGDTLVTLGLGSCVAVMLHDPAARVGGLAHVLLPDTSHAREQKNPAKFARTAIPHLVGAMERLGARRERLTARLAGGACMFSGLMTTRGMNMGARNLIACRETLAELDIPERGADVGGEHGRSVRFCVGEGKVVITSVLRDDVVL